MSVSAIPNTGAPLTHHRFVYALVGACLTMFVPIVAQAQFYVRSPDVEKGETHLEEHGAVYSGPGEDERLRQTHELEFKHGLTDRFALIIEGFLEQPIGENLEATEFEIGGQYEFVERHDDGFGLAFRTIYEVTKDEADEILFGPLARLVKGRNSTTLNAFFVGQLGDEAEIDGLELKINWQLKHELNDRIALAMEAYGEIEDLAHAGSFDEQAYRVGPVVYFEFENEGSKPGAHEYGFEIGAGILFGVTDVISDTTFKFDLELEF